MSKLFDKSLDIYRKRYNHWFKKKRFDFINGLLGEILTEPNVHGKKIIEVGCHVGRDFLAFFDGVHDIELYGMDVHPYQVPDYVQFIHGDAERIHFPDHYFDVTVSIGVLEHIEPISKLSQMINEIERVSKNFCVVMPCISTIFEPHANSFFWQFRAPGKMKNYPRLNYFSDEAWMAFDGFNDCRITRFSAMGGLIKNVCIYRNDYA